MHASETFKLALHMLLPLGLQIRQGSESLLIELCGSCWKSSSCSSRLAGACITQDECGIARPVPISPSEGPSILLPSARRAVDSWSSLLSFSDGGNRDEGSRDGRLASVILSVEELNRIVVDCEKGLDSNPGDLQQPLKVCSFPIWLRSWLA